MILLVTDTSGKNGSVALARSREDSDAVELIEEAPLSGGTFSAQLVPQVAALLARHGLSKSAIDAFVVVSGPGSFTGLRVGLAAVKGLAEILQKPIAAVSLLEAVALAARTSGRVMTGRVTAALDGGRGEVYVGEYEVSGESVQLLREQLLSKADFSRAALGSAVSTPDQTLAGMSEEAGLSVFTSAFPGSATIARLGWKKMQAGETVTPDQLEANYIRRTDAELFLKPSF
jgi:tRNA threonylcarbamoyladenosine biosynthesis protein TsaB